ncbi:M14 family zinc carboxypeptidase [Halalkalicoccus tibetensis]|uniref:M14 family zinc carboxypeptidase n=1 Tax=Halalkalicoccus tibetensis TaxID=175632 RepID=A0ABD5V129_9EURY
MSEQRRSPNGEGSRFGDGTVDRREFLALSAAMAGALALPGMATAELEDDRLTDRYAFVINHTDDDYEAATLIRLAEGATDDVSGWAIETTTDPGPAAYARLTTAEVEEVLAVEGVERLEFSPGSNPFWKLDSYPGRVFHPPEESVEYVGYRETVAGLTHLAEEHPDRLAFSPIGETHGHENLLSGEQDPQDVWVAELTNDHGESFADKPKAVFTIGIHGDERAGVEAGVRLIEEVLRGERPEVDDLLEEVALVFVTANPDGWVSRKPEFASRFDDFQRGTPALQRGVDEADVEEPWEGSFHLDSNRQYPSLGWIDPINFPGKPDGAPSETEERVPDATSVVSHLRGYDDIEYVADYHGMQWADHFVLSLIANGDFDLTDQHALDEVNRRIDRGMIDALGSRDDIEDAILASAERQYADQLREPLDLGDDWLPPQLNDEGLFEWGSIHDTLSYQVGGALLCWAGQPEEAGGLGARTIAPEMAWSNSQEPMEKRFVPETVDVQATAYQVSMVEIATILAQGVEATIDAGGTTTAYVTSDAVERSSEELAFTQAETESSKTDVTVEDGESETVTIEVPTGTNSLDVHIRPEFGSVRVTIRDPDGEAVVETDELSGHGDTVGCACMEHDETEQFLCEPAPGEWTIEVEGLDGESAVSLWTLAVSGEAEGVASPDPADVLGYEQREYDVSPLAFFEDHDAYIEDGGFEPVTVEEVCEGVLLEDGKPAYGNVVVIHDDGADRPIYAEALDAYTEAGGDLVLTDDGVRLAGVMDAGIDAEAIGEVTETVSHLASKEDHPLLDGVRGIEAELWKPAPLGYPVTDAGTAPTTVIDADEFEAAGGTVAGWLGEDEEGYPRVAAGSIDGSIHVIGGLLPPANQRYLHPFGLLDYCLSYAGQTVLLNALGYDQHRTVDGEETPESAGDERAALSASE